MTSRDSVGAYDDGVARLYRAAEMVTQADLFDETGYSTSASPRRPYPKRPARQSLDPIEHHKKR